MTALLISQTDETVQTKRVSEINEPTTRIVQNVNCADYRRFVYWVISRYILKN